MRNTWESGTFWLTLAIGDPLAFASIFWHRILPYHFDIRADDKTDFSLLASLWGSLDIIEQKVQDHDRYVKRLEDIF